MPQEEVGPFVSKIKEVFSKIFGLPVPTIVALDGKFEDGAILYLHMSFNTAIRRVKQGKTFLFVRFGAGRWSRISVSL